MGNGEVIYIQALAALNDAEIDYMVGGAFAVYHYTNWWRDTHDIDVYVTPENTRAAMTALTSAGFDELGEQAHGDNEWIFHAGKDEIMVDVIWRFANLANYVSPEWFDRAPRGTLMGMNVTFLPLEELIWVKVFVINRHRCDWPDIMRIARAQCARIDWGRLLGLIGEHWLLLAGLIDVFDWQHPDSISCVPDEIRDELAGRRIEYRASAPRAERECLLDPWIHHRTDRYETGRNEQSDD